ncbi:hypothetical protein [Streptomyces sp. SD15]
MLRGTTARTLYLVLAAVLISLQLFAPTESFASAHKGDVVSCGDAEHPQKTAPPLGARQRAGDEDLVPETLARVMVESDPAAANPLPSRSAAHHPGASRSSRSSTVHSPEALQVFRC